MEPTERPPEGAPPPAQQPRARAAGAHERLLSRAILRRRLLALLRPEELFESVLLPLGSGRGAALEHLLLRKDRQRGTMRAEERVRAPLQQKRSRATHKAAQRSSVEAQLRV